MLTTRGQEGKGKGAPLHPEQRELQPVERELCPGVPHNDGSKMGQGGGAELRAKESASNTKGQLTSG